ncbi:LysA protein [Mycobacterium sp. CVI_P3]|uniref:LysA protein n=1 Tax=Mycobacterium pinniadriaticum TaxID=2994102 RepID=A0ABT3SFL5_9MYCO|nr:LysA protein [Mycobacterium pinniadriaticum]MCX2931104.1 LysA protein [Mycobacterium pinniadriaticum]MCX2937672.1 LysA protein [Mycobacterium pinniadriaticum]
MTLSTGFRSLVPRRRYACVENPEVRRMIGYRDSCAPAEVSFPAAALRDSQVARWLREQRLTVDVRTLAELHSAISVGIHPMRMTVHADRLDGRGIRRVRAAGVGRVVLSRPEQMTWLGVGRVQNVLLRMTDTVTPAAGGGCDFVFDSSAADTAADAVVDCRSTALIGLVCEIGPVFDGPAVIGNMIAQMDHIRRRHNVVLTRLTLGVGDAGVAAGSSIVRRDLAEEVSESVHDACAAMRFPCPAIVMAA